MPLLTFCCFLLTGLGDGLLVAALLELLADVVLMLLLLLLLLFSIPSRGCLLNNKLLLFRLSDVNRLMAGNADALIGENAGPFDG